MSEVWYNMLPKHDSGKTAVHRWVAIYSLCAAEMKANIGGPSGATKKRSRSTSSSAARKCVKEKLKELGKWDAKHLDMYVGQAMGKVLDNPSLLPALDYMLKAVSDLEARPIVTNFCSSIMHQVQRFLPCVYNAATLYVRRIS